MTLIGTSELALQNKSPSFTWPESLPATGVSRAVWAADFFIQHTMKQPKGRTKRREPVFPETEVLNALATPPSKEELIETLETMIDASIGGNAIMDDSPGGYDMETLPAHVLYDIRNMRVAQEIVRKGAA